MVYTSEGLTEKTQQYSSHLQCRHAVSDKLTKVVGKAIEQGRGLLGQSIL